MLSNSLILTSLDALQQGCIRRLVDNGFANRSAELPFSRGDVMHRFRVACVVLPEDNTVCILQANKILGSS